MKKLHREFTKYHAKVALQNSILRIIRETPVDVLKSLPLNYKTLRPPPIECLRYALNPGEMIYFGIKRILSLRGVNFFDFNASEVHLSVGIDGVPLYRSKQGYGFWPITASVGHYPVFMIGFYCGQSKPNCPNAFLKPFIDEVNELQDN